MTKQDELWHDIQQKYASLGQDPLVYLEGLVHARPITYWDYVEVDSLLNLQRPRTEFKDEMIFIVYHQVTELLFKMILWEIQQIADQPKLEATFFVERLGRINRYFGVLISSFDIMRGGMEVGQYLQFRNTLTPASGFQSAQYRCIEICSTDLHNLIYHRYRHSLPANASIETQIAHLYWQAAGKNFDTGEKTITLRLFEERYLPRFMQLAAEYQTKNLWQRYLNLPVSEKTRPELVAAMRALDHKINIDWVMAHYRTAEHYLESGGEAVAATGGSPWRKYMHPRYQRRIFFPGLWSEQELATWGEGLYE
jgi:tryptophan 2,3-dioxygenase